MPPGTYDLLACKKISGTSSYYVGEMEVTLVANETQTLNDADALKITAQPSCPQPATHAPFYRRVSVGEAAGSMFLLDDEWWPYDDETSNVSLSAIKIDPFQPDEVMLCRNHEGTGCVSAYTFKFLACTGAEVRGELDVLVRFPSGASVNFENVAIEATVTLKLYEGTSCENMDLDGSWNSTLTVNDGATVPVNPIARTGEWCSDDMVSSSLAIVNDPFGGLEEINAYLYD